MRRGFTIVECLISLLLLTITLVGSMAFYFFSTGSLAAATHRRIAAEAANAQMENIKNNGYTDLPDPAPSPPGLWEGPVEISIGGLTGQQEVYVFDEDEGGSDYKMVKVRITWNEPEKAGQEEIALATYMAPR